ncbi:hypothetical protein [Sphingobacterium bovisgrunnientis]|uniref:hypothetical protein n=1 Tax=Sphingobacterium bovisgrunnientis TaxID=1874697 RepID=UPI00135A1A17|nr:hypothetical protein [Sphingobacterium bovisgrunnientis]
MATELEGKPLKFTAVFESKDAEMKMDEFLKKVQNINTKGVSNNAAKAVNQSSGQYKSILTDVTQSFNDFVTSNDRFYSAIAKSELALRKVNVEQNYLNAEMRRGLITDEEYIQKSAQLAQVRERLSAQLKDNKAQLQQYNSVASTKPKFTRQDTLNELGSAHGNLSASPNLSATEAFARATQQSIDKLNAELLELDANLKSGAITNDQYAKSTADINNKLKEAQLNQEHFNQNIGKGFAPTEEISKQKTVLDAVSSEYKELISEASSAFQSISPEAQKLTNNLVGLREENRKLVSAQKELDEAYKRGDITLNQYLQASRDLGVQQGAIKTRIAETRKEISQIDAAERKAIGSIAEKTAKLTQLKQRYDQLSEAQRNNINVGGKIRKEYQDLTKEVNKLNTSLSGTKSDGVGALFSSIQGIAGVMGIAFGTQQLVSFGKELFSIAQRAEGVELAFARIGDPTALDRLRVATKGTVSDLDLMTQAVRADKFRIPMDVLAKGLEFARRRANETGQSIDYLTESFVNGLGRQSKLILDNLGISTIELSEEIEKTGNFMKAVSNIMDKDLSRGGQVIDMLSDKTDRLAARWENVKKKISDAMRAWFYTGAGGASPEGIEKHVIALNKAYEGFDNRNSEQQKKVINQIQSELDFEKKRSQSIAKSIEQESIKRYGKVDAAFVSTLSQQKGLDKSLEKLNALEATLLKFKGANAELDKQNRQKQGIFNLEELEEKLSGAQTALKTSVDKNEQAKLRKEIAGYQKQIEAINGKSSKKADAAQREQERKLEQARQALERERKLQGDIDTLANQSTRNQLSRNEEEIASIKDKYAKMSEEIRKFYADPKNKGLKVDEGKLKQAQDFEISEAKTRQEGNDLLKQLNEQRKIYDEYYSYLESTSKEEADKRFKDDLPLINGFIDRLRAAKIQFASLGDLASNSFDGVSGALTQAQKEVSDGIDALEKDVNDKRVANERNRIAEALQLAQDFNAERLKIEKKYQDARVSLGKAITPEEDKELTRKENKEKSQLAVTQLQESDAWASLFSDLDNKTVKQIETLIAEIEKQFDDLSVNFDPIDLAATRKKLQEAKDIIIDTNPFKAVGVALKGIFKGASDDSTESAEEIRQHWTNLSKATNKSFAFIENAINSAEFLGDALGETGKKAMSVLSGVAMTATAVATAIKSAEKASVVLAIIQAALVAMQAVFSFIDGAAKRRNEELKKEQEYYNVLSDTFDVLIEKQKQLFEEKNGKGALKAYRDALDLIGSKQVANRKSLEAWFAQGASWKSHSNWYNYDKELGNVLSRQKLLNMSGSEWENLLRKQPELWAKLPEEVRTYAQSVIDAKGETEDLKKAIQEALTGVSLDDLRGEFENLASMADLTFEDISKSFYKHMQKAVLRMIQDEKFSADMQRWYDNLLAATEDENLTQDEADLLKQQYQSIAEAQNARYKAIMDVIGSPADSSSDTTIGGKFKREITEKTGGEIVGIFRAGYDIWKQQLVAIQAQSATNVNILAIANEKLIALNAIQVNTANTVQRLDVAVKHLDTIVKNTSKTGRSAEGMGL